MRRALAVLCLWMCAPVARAQPAVVQVVTAPADARDVATLQGRTYVATEGGLQIIRQGVVEATLGPRAGLPGARLRSVSVVDGELWVGAVEGTARARLEGDGLRVLETFDVRRVRRAVRFGGDVWLASYGDGLFRIRDGVPEPVHLGEAGAYRRLTDLTVRDGELWIATQGVGVLRVDPEGHIVGRLRRRHGLRSPFLWRFVTAGDRLLITSIAGLVEVGSDGTIDRDGALARTAHRLPVRDLRAALVTEDALWLGTFGRGLWRAPREGGRPRRVGRLDAVQALAPGAGGVLVAHRDGLHLAEGRRLRALAAGGLRTGDTTALARAFGRIWVGTYGHGLAQLRDGSLRPVRTDRWRIDARVNDLAVSGRGRGRRLWIATDRGLYWHDGRIFSRVEDPDGPSWIHTTSVHVAPGGAVWVTTGRELCRLRAERWRCWTGDERFPVAQLHAVTTDRAGRVWVGSLHGLFRFDPRAERFERHTVSSGDLPVDWVTALVPWGDGVMAGTYHGGLAIGDGTRFRIVREAEDGLPSGWVNPHAIRRIEGAAWIGTLSRGLVIGRPGAWAHLTTADGLPSDDVTDALAVDDGVWVATRGGLALVTP